MCFLYFYISYVVSVSYFISILFQISSHPKMNFWLISSYFWKPPWKFKRKNPFYDDNAHIIATILPVHNLPIYLAPLLISPPLKKKNYKAKALASAFSLIFFCVIFLMLFIFCGCSLYCTFLKGFLIILFNVSFMIGRMQTFLLLSLTGRYLGHNSLYSN